MKRFSYGPVDQVRQPTSELAEADCKKDAQGHVIWIERPLFDDISLNVMVFVSFVGTD